MAATKSLKKLPIDTTIYTGQVLKVGGWGGGGQGPGEQFVKNLRQEACGPNKKQALHISALELLGAKLGLLRFFKDNKHIRVVTDNNTAVSYINNMGELDLICVMILLSIYGNGLQNHNYGFQQPTSQDLKMS